MTNFKKEKYFLILFILSVMILATAFIIQYILGYQPCNLCLIERVPYMLAIIVLILNYRFQGDQFFYVVLLLLIFSFSFLISIYHLGIEQGLFDESLICASKNVDLLTKEEVLNSMKEFNISCKDVAFKIFGLSLTTYNIIISIFMFLISTKIFLINNDLKK